MPKGVYDHCKIRGVKRPSGVGRNISASMKGKNTYPRTKEHKNKIGISAKITHNRPEVREKKRQRALEFWEDYFNIFFQIKSNTLVMVKIKSLLLEEDVQILFLLMDKRKL